MKKINRNTDITEQPIYQWECKDCNELNESYDDLEHETTVICEHCLEEFELTD